MNERLAAWYEGGIVGGGRGGYRGRPMRSAGTLGGGEWCVTFPVCRASPHGRSMVPCAGACVGGKGQEWRTCQQWRRSHVLDVMRRTRGWTNSAGIKDCSDVRGVDVRVETCRKGRGVQWGDCLCIEQREVKRGGRTVHDYGGGSRRRRLCDEKYAGVDDVPVVVTVLNVMRAPRGVQTVRK